MELRRVALTCMANICLRYCYNMLEPVAIFICVNCRLYENLDVVSII